MSKEKIEAFVAAVSNSEELQKQFVSIQVEVAKLTAQKIAKLSESTGTPFTAEEYLQSVADSSDQMSAEQLQSVAGGVWEPTANNIVTSIFIGILCAIVAAASAREQRDVDACQFR
jgi:Nif11 domain